MKKILGTIVILIIISSICHGQPTNAKPDLVFDKFKLVRQDDIVFLDWSIKNIGDSPSGNDSIRVNISFCYFGVDFLFQNGLTGFYGPDDPFARLLAIIAFITHFYFMPTSYHTRATDSLDPGQNGTCWFGVSWPLNKFMDDGWFFNDNICFVFRGIIDENNTIAESDETNNQAVIRIWFPYRNEFAVTFCECEFLFHNSNRFEGINC